MRAFRAQAAEWLYLYSCSCPLHSYKTHIHTPSDWAASCLSQSAHGCPRHTAKQRDHLVTCYGNLAVSWLFCFFYPCFVQYNHSGARMKTLVQIFVLPLILVTSAYSTQKGKWQSLENADHLTVFCLFLKMSYRITRYYSLNPYTLHEKWTCCLHQHCENLMK